MFQSNVTNGTDLSNQVELPPRTAQHPYGRPHLLILIMWEVIRAKHALTVGEVVSVLNRLVLHDFDEKTTNYT